MDVLIEESFLYFSEEYVYLTHSVGLVQSCYKCSYKYVIGISWSLRVSPSLCHVPPLSDINHHPVTEGSVIAGIKNPCRSSMRQRQRPHDTVNYELSIQELITQTTSPLEIR